MGDTHDDIVVATVVAPSPSPPLPPPPPCVSAVNAELSAIISMNPTMSTDAPVPTNMTTPPIQANQQISPADARSSVTPCVPTVVVIDDDSAVDPMDLKYDNPTSSTVYAAAVAADSGEDELGSEYTRVGRHGRPERTPPPPSPSPVHAPPPPTMTNDNCGSVPVSHNTNQARRAAHVGTMPHLRYNPDHLVPLDIPHRQRFLDRALIASIPIIKDVEQRQFTIVFDLSLDQCKNVTMTNKWTYNARRLIRAKVKCPSLKDMSAVHVERRPPIYNALDRMTRAKVISPTEEALTTFQRTGVPTSNLRVRIVLFYETKDICADANKAFSDEGIPVCVSHPSSFCGRAYNVPTEYDADSLRHYIHLATRNHLFAQSFAFRRLRSPSTGFATTTVEWAALSEAATAVCNVQFPIDGTGIKLYGIVWRVAEKGKRLPDTFLASSLLHNCNIQPVPAGTPTIQRSYAAALSASSNIQQPALVTAARVPPPTLPVTVVPQPVSVTPPTTATDTVLVSKLLQHLEQMQDAATRRERAQNEFNTNLLNRMNDMMKSSIDQFTHNMQLMQTVFTNQSNALASLTATVNRLQVSGASNPPTPHNTHQASPAPQRRSTSTVRRRSQQTPSAPPPVQPAVLSSASSDDTSLAGTDHRSDPTDDSDTNTNVGMNMSQLTYSQTSVVSATTSDTTQVLAQEISLHSLSSSDDTAPDPEPKEHSIAVTNTNNVARRLSLTAAVDNITTTVRPTSIKTGTGIQLRIRKPIKVATALSVEEKQSNYTAMNPPRTTHCRRTSSAKGRKKILNNKQ